jgi:hypothetical protein
MTSLDKPEFQDLALSNPETVLGHFQNYLPIGVVR